MLIWVISKLFPNHIPYYSALVFCFFLVYICFNKEVNTVFKELRKSNFISEHLGTFFSTSFVHINVLRGNRLIRYQLIIDLQY